MTDTHHDQVRENILIEGLRDWIHLSEIHSAFMPKDGSALSLPDVQRQTLGMVRELVTDGLFVLGVPSPTKDNPAGFTVCDLPLGAAMAKIEDAYIVHFDDRDWQTIVWLDQTSKGKELALQLWDADEPEP